jgi:hypothetical protein
VYSRVSCKSSGGEFAWVRSEAVLGHRSSTPRHTEYAHIEHAPAREKPSEPLLAQLYAASIAGTLVMGAKAGERQVRLFGVPARQGEQGGKLKNAYGFDLDAAVRVEADDKTCSMGDSSSHSGT